MNIIFVTAAALLAAKILLKSIIGMLCSMEKEICNAMNYRGKKIPAIGGMVFIPVQLVTVLLLMLSHTGEQYENVSYIALILSMGFAGVIDDLIGDIKIKGLIKHIRSTLDGTITTGFIKALIGFTVSGIISIEISGTYIEFILNVLIISLFANTINLLDLRPGRAVKTFIVLSAILLTVYVERLTEAASLLILFLTALIYMDYDLKEICMLGDTGANILGATLGYYSALFVGTVGKLVLLALLILLHAVTERLSITDLINNNSLLSYLDELGREHGGNR